MASLAMTELAQAAAASWQPQGGGSGGGGGSGSGDDGSGSGRSLGWQDVFDVVVRWRQAGPRHKNFNFGIFEVNKWDRSSGIRDKRLKV